MPRFDARGLCRWLLDAEAEAEVETIIASTPEMADRKNWRPLDGRETNFNMWSNQASDGGKALTELMTNMVDAVLTKHALLKGIDPKGPKAPSTMYEAVDQLIKPMQGGKLTNVDPRDPWLNTFARSNLTIGVTGARSKRAGFPCYTFVDNGEGQSPDKFESTFLSLSTGNKKDIPFVQGKYNMGSSGVIGYCGLRGFKLIISRRYDCSAPWGFTLMRKRPGSGMPVAEYFVLPGGKIPSFEEDILYPFVKGDRKRYDGVHLSSGTVIKLYDYQIGSRFAGGFRGSREALNENLIETILPFLILDFRQSPDLKRGPDRAAGIDPRRFCGMEFLLLRAHKEVHDDDEEEAVGTTSLAVSTDTYKDLGQISISAIRLKRKLPGWLHSSNNRVFHAVNGQAQFKQTRGYLSQTCGFPALKDRIIVIVDASNLSFEAHNEVWKGDREHVRDTIMGERYKEVVTAAIRESEALKALQQEIAQEELQQAANTERDELFQKLVNADPHLAALLTNRDPVIKLPSAGTGEKGGGPGAGEFVGKYSPTFLRLEERMKQQGIALPINRSRPVTARTDVENGYLQRPDNKGRLLIKPSLADHFGVRVQLHDGRLTIYFEPVEDALKVGDVFTFTIELQDDAMPVPVEDTLFIRIIDEQKDAKQETKKKEPSAGDKKTKEREGPDVPTHGLPHVVLLTKDGHSVANKKTEAWPEGFTELDGGYVDDFGKEGTIYKINYDNAYHLKYRLTARGDIARDVVTEKYILGMRILMLGYEHALRAFKEMKNGAGEGLAEFQDEFRRVAARGAASIVLALAENLPRIVDKSTVLAGQDVE